MVFVNHIVHRVHDHFGLFLFLHLHVMDLRQYRRILLHLLHQLVDHLRAGPMFLGNIGLDLLFHQTLWTICIFSTTDIGFHFLILFLDPIGVGSLKSM